MKTTQYKLLEIITGKDHESIMVRTLMKQGCMNGKVVSVTVLKSSAEKRISLMRMNSFVSEEYILTEQQVQTFQSLEDLFQIDVSALDKISA